MGWPVGGYFRAILSVGGGVEMSATTTLVEHISHCPCYISFGCFVWFVVVVEFVVVIVESKDMTNSKRDTHRVNVPIVVQFVVVPMCFNGFKV